MSKHITGLILVLLIIKTSAQIPVSFPAEYIDFKIDNQFFTINGIYTFKNLTKKAIYPNIKFPFPVDVSSIDSIRIINLYTQDRIEYSKRNKDIIFNVPIPANDSVDINLFYRQSTDKKNTYILTTTKSWEAPIDKAIYILTISNSLKIDSFSMVPDSVKIGSAEDIYFWSKLNFEPLIDFEVNLRSY